jgi:hypothetical protein
VRHQEDNAVLRRVILLSLVVYLVQSAIPAYAQRADQTTAADKTRAAVVKVGTCPRAKIEVFFNNKTSLKGCVVDVSEDHFGIVDAKTGKVTRATYDEVAKVKRRERPLWQLFAVTGAVIALPIILVAVSLRGS